jgi:hypothetical protein
VQITEIYNGLKDQAGALTGMEKQIQGLIDTNTKNLQDTDCLKLTNNRSGYFENQHKCFNVLFEAVVDLKIINNYNLLEIESQLREEVKI